jgi:hypothetical protein
LNTYLIIAIGVVLLYIATHLRPLTASEIRYLAKKRRRKSIADYFTFSSDEFMPDIAFKRQMNPNGAFYYVDESLYDFPAIAASLLKYKKHEWIIIGLEKRGRIKTIWVNKGKDNRSVESYLSPEKIASMGYETDASTILIFHNHPNSNPNLYSNTKASKQDYVSAKIFAKEINAKGGSLIEFVCERGNHYEYFRSVSDSFLPVAGIVKEIENLNGISKWKNLILHLERIF